MRLYLIILFIFFPILANSQDLPAGNIIYMLNGEKIAFSELEKINPNDIESIEVVKDKERIKVSTDEDCDGLIMIKTKGPDAIPVELLEATKEFLNREQYDVLTSEILDSLSDNELEQAIFDNICSHDADGFPAIGIIENLSEGQKAIFSTWIVEAEVNNGGFNQFYFNSGEYDSMAVAGYKSIGAYQFAQLMEIANKTYQEIEAKLAEFDDGTIESFSDSYEDNPLNELDEKFYNLYEVENLHELKVKYIRNHYSEFILE